MPDTKKVGLPGDKLPKQVETSAPPKKLGRPKKYVFVCCSCGAEYNKQEGNFLTSTSTLFENNNGYVPICKSCLEKYYMQTLLPALDYDDARAMEVICALCDWYYSEDVLQMSKKAQESQNSGVLTSIYSGRRLLKHIKARGLTYIDTILQRREAAMKIMTSDEASGSDVDPDANHVEIGEDVFKMFGPGYTADEYEYLAEQYQDWTSRYEVNTKALETCIQSLCVSQLNIRRAQKDGNAKSASDAMKSFQDMLTTAKLSPKQTKEDQLAQTETFGTLIKRWEDERPIPEPSPEFADVDGIKKLITVFFFGHLCKMFNIKNDYSDLYDREMDQYTVTRPAWAEETEDDEQRTEALFSGARIHEKNSDDAGAEVTSKESEGGG